MQNHVRKNFVEQTDIGNRPEHQVKLWAHRCLESHYNLGLYIANLPAARWVQRAPRWKPAGARVAGHP